MVEDSESLGIHGCAKTGSNSSRTSTNPFSKKESTLKNGFQCMTPWDYHMLLYGYSRLNIKGYLNSKRISLDRLGVPYEVPIDDHPANMLYDFYYSRHDYYLDKIIPYKNTVTGEWILIKPIVRGDLKYCQRQLAKFKRLERWASSKNIPIVHLRLSLCAPDGLSAPMALALMRSIPNRFQSFLQSVLPYRPKCVWCIEPTERGMCHFHMLFFGSEWLISKELIDNWWRSQGLGTSSGVWIERLRGGKQDAHKMVGYLIKYVTKPSQNPYWSGLVSIMGAREFGFSNRLNKDIEAWENVVSERSERTASVLTCTNKTNSKWECAGLLDKLLVESLLEYSPLLSVEELINEVASIRGSIKRLNESHWSRLAS